MRDEQGPRGGVEAPPHAPASGRGATGVPRGRPHAEPAEGLPALLKQLRSTDCSIVAAAAHALASGGVAVPHDALLQARVCISSRRGIGERMSLAQDYLSLVDREAPEAASQLIRSSDDPAVRSEAFWALAECGEPALRVLTELARDVDESIRRHAYEAVRHIGGTATIPLLVDGLADADFSVRWIASDALVEIGDPAIKPVLAALVHRTPSEPLHRAACRVLRRWRPAAPDRAARDGLVVSLSRATTIYESGPLALAVLLRLRDEERA